MKFKKILKYHLITDYIGIDLLQGRPIEFYRVSEVLEMKKLLNRHVILISAAIFKSTPCLHEEPVAVYLLADDEEKE